MNAHTALSSADPRALSREVKAELNLLIASVPSDARKVSALLAEYDLIIRRSKIASGRATKSVDKIAAGLLALGRQADRRQASRVTKEKEITARLAEWRSSRQLLSSRAS